MTKSNPTAQAAYRKRLAAKGLIHFTAWITPAQKKLVLEYIKQIKAEVKL